MVRSPMLVNGPDVRNRGGLRLLKPNWPAYLPPELGRWEGETYHQNVYVIHPASSRHD